MTAGKEPVVALRGVNHHLGEGALRRQILFDITTEILPGEIVMVMGPSGSGKTTLLNLIGTTRTVVDGSVRVLGRELRGASSAEITDMRRRLGFVFQHHHLLDALTACQNVQMGLGGYGLSQAETQKRSLAILGQVGLGDHAHSFPKQLSGGQCQRVAVARALVRDSELVLADEPTAALDKQTGREIVELLRRLARERGCTVVMVTHDPRILDVADRLMYLEDGRLSSFATVTSAHAVHLLTSLRPVLETGQLRTFFGHMKDPAFVDLMRGVGIEAEQFLNVIEFGSPMETSLAFQALMEAALERLCKQTGARTARLWVRSDPDALLCIGCTHAPEDAFPKSGLEALSSGEIRNEGDTLSIPLQNRDGELSAVLTMEGIESALEVGRQVRDFTRAFGLLVQIATTPVV